MNRKEAIEILKAYPLVIKDQQAIQDAIEFAIPSLETDEAYQLEYERPTTKNDLGADCISRDSAIKALDYDIKHFEFKSGVSKHMDDIAKLLNTIYETQVNNIKALPSVTPQEPILDKIFCLVHPLSIMSTPELEHKTIMQIAEMLEPLCLPESEET